ncbi:calcium-binding protein [uncultured Tateyamaria sp.]|uniref:calcium-binding protein n=1 Tax=uncultured Tateyamaria sp. TaxID=455651 RepID=UPI00261E2CC4|nr:calcium-binding protein [uncultured Tateyamaria sp.]
MSDTHISVTNVTISEQQVAKESFGINFAFNYQSFGSAPWEKFDEIVADYLPSQIRFPAGTYSETVFDIENPDATEYIDEHGNARHLVSMTEMLNFARVNGTNAVVVIPSAFALGDVGPNGGREFDPAARPLIQEYVRFLLELAGDGVLSRLEIGNEYAAYMTSLEYGRIASEIALIVQQEIDQFRHQENLGADWEEPQIAIQIFGQSPGGGNSISDLDARNERVIGEFNDEELSAVDAVVDHFYYYEGRNYGESNSHTISNIEAAVSTSTRRFDIWQESTTTELLHVISEWNTSHFTIENAGLSQIPYVLKMFSQFVQDGVDELDFWSSQYHNSSLYDAQGNAMIMGRVFTEFRGVIEGSMIMDVETSSNDIAISAFQGDEHVTLFISSISSEEIQFSFDLNGFLPGYLLDSATRISVDPSSADGVYKSHSDLPIYLEPDVDYVFDTFLVGSLASLESAQFDVGAFETIVLTLRANRIDFGEVAGEELAPTSTLATAGYRVLSYSESSVSILGNRGVDILSVDESQAGYEIDIQTGEEVGRFFSIEGIVGSEGLDVLRGNGEDNVLFGSGGSDVLHGRWGMDELYGGTGNDTLQGGEGADYLSGGSGIDTATYLSSVQGVTVDLLQFWKNTGDASGDILLSVENLEGSQFHDTLLGNDKANRLFGGGGHDLLVGRGGGDWILGGEGVDTISGGNGRDRLLGGTAGDSIYGGFGADFLYGQAGDDELFGGQGGDRLEGHTGQDRMHGGHGRDSIFGGDGRDTMLGGAGNDYMEGQEGEDLLFAGQGSDVVLGGDSADELHGNRGQDLMYGGQGHDYILGGVGDDTLFGNGGNDYLEGHSGSDSLFGGDGNDFLLGGNGNDELRGGQGRDSVHGGAGNDTIFGGDGNDLLEGHRGEDFLNGGNGNDSLIGGGASDELHGEQGQDTLDGGNGNDVLDGGLDRDLLNGGHGNDRLYGSDGDDTLYGGGGSDWLTGGSGSDTFIFDGISGSDIVLDFNVGEDIVRLATEVEQAWLAWNGNHLQITTANGSSFILRDIGVHSTDEVFSFFDDHQNLHWL